MFGSLAKIFFQNRVLFAAYLSVLLHITFLIYSFNHSDSPYGKTLCGPNWIYADEDEEKSFSISFGKDIGDGDSDEGGESNANAEGEPGDSNKEGFPKGKYDGGAWEELVKDLESTSDLRKKFKNNLEDLIPNSGVSESYMKRNRDYEDIIVKEVFPTVKTIHDPFRVDLKDAEDNLAVHKERNRIIEEFRKGEESSPPITITRIKDGESRPRSPLSMAKPDRQRYLDKTIKQSKEKQLDEFISKFMGYDPDKGDLSLFVRDLYYENLQRLAFQFSSDPTYFAIDYFQENLNKEDFLRQSLALLSEHLGTKVGTEILFTIENIYEIQSYALKRYFESEALLKALPADETKTLRHETLRRVIKKMNPVLKEQKLRSEIDVQSAYVKKRLEILDTLIKNSPKQYRWKDAYFQKGVVLWEFGKFKGDKQLLVDAIQTWSKIPSLSSEGDFLFQSIWERMEWALKDAGPIRSVDDLSYQLENQLDMSVRFRLSEGMAKKNEREERLLWPKTSKKKESDN